jgi:GntR family transcriptional regulator/MocR family aminotransferase
MPGWNLALALSAPDGPLFLQIARAIMNDVRRGRLRPRDELPGSRALAQSLGVHRNTVLAAYRELSAEGWVTTDPARGTFVSSALPDVAPRRFAPADQAREQISARVGYALPPAESALALPPPPGVLSLNGGIPDVRLVPTAAIARAYRRALRRGGKALLGYADPRGCPELRTALADMLSATRGLAARAENVMVTRGSQLAIDLVCRTLVQPGDVVAVEALGYRPAWEALRGAGAVVKPIALDDDGMRVDALAALVAKETVRAVYVTPHHQYPTTAVLAAGRRLELLDLARRARILIIEDDYDHEFHYDGRPVLPLASADRAGVVVYVGTLSKVLAPGLRIGYLVAPAPVVDRVAARRASVDRQGDHAIEWAVAELLEDGEVQRHTRRARRVYQQRRDVLIAALRAELGEVLTFRAPAGGTALWAHVAPRYDVAGWVERALARGVAMQAAQQFAFDGRARPSVRLGFAQLNDAELREAVRRLRLALRA